MSKPWLYLVSGINFNLPLLRLDAATVWWKWQDHPAFVRHFDRIKVIECPQTVTLASWMFEIPALADRLNAYVEHVRGAIKGAPAGSVVLGHSFGGAAAVLAANGYATVREHVGNVVPLAGRLPRFSAVVTVNAPSLHAFGHSGELTSCGEERIAFHGEYDEYLAQTHAAFYAERGFALRIGKYGHIPQQHAAAAWQLPHELCQLLTHGRWGHLFTRTARHA